jgi:hypothetical protein
MDGQPKCFVDQLNIDEQYNFIIEEIEWERIQVTISGTITANKPKDTLNYRDIAYYLYSPIFDQHLECRYSRTDNCRFSIRINVMSINHLYPLLRGNWYLYAAVGGQEVYARVANHVDRKSVV